MANEAMAQAWGGEEGDHWAENADRYDTVSERVMGTYIPQIALRAEDRVLDIGCGAGGLTLALAPRCAHVHGVDLSSQMLEVARKRAADRGIVNATFEQADAQTDNLGTDYDVAVSSFGAMFFDDPVAAFTNIAAALKPGGRVAFIAWRPLQDNEWLMGIRASLAMGRDLPFPPLEAPTPFALSSPDRNRSLFEAAGFTDVVSTPVDEPMVLGTNADDAFDFFGNVGIAKGLSHDLDATQRAEGFAKLRQFLADHETPEGVLVDSAAFIITATKL